MRRDTLTVTAAGLCRSHGSLSKDDVRAALGKVLGPDGKPLPETGTLSDIVVTDGKVFFSITVDAAAVPQWEPVRARAEQRCARCPA